MNKYERRRRLRNWKICRIICQMEENGTLADRRTVDARELAKQCNVDILTAIDVFNKLRSFEYLNPDTRVRWENECRNDLVKYTVAFTPETAEKVEAWALQLEKPVEYAIEDCIRESVVLSTVTNRQE